MRNFNLFLKRAIDIVAADSYDSDSASDSNSHCNQAYFKGSCNFHTGQNGKKRQNL